MTLGNLTIKVGEMNKTSRANVPLHNTLFKFDEDEGLEVLNVKVDDLVGPATVTFEPKTTRIGMKVYMKPEHHSVQRDLVTLTQDNMHSKIEYARLNYEKRQK
uniref:Uncharacterized protein n=1 Tax=Globisporangium ultimum (strain ATCC 200006 / CBS 805.95 / DAOM BR144) TaxID=431595 RepID=K3WAF5_GLOUD